MQIRMGQLRRIIKEELIRLHEDWSDNVSDNALNSEILMHYAEVAEAYANTLHSLANAAQHLDVANVTTLLEMLSDQHDEHELVLIELLQNIAGGEGSFSSNQRSGQA